MTRDEIKAAFISQCPVIHRTSKFSINKDIEYKCISAIKYSYTDGQIVISLELKSKTGNSRTSANPKFVEVVNDLFKS